MVGFMLRIFLILLVISSKIAISSGQVSDGDATETESLRLFQLMTKVHIGENTPSLEDILSQAENRQKDLDAFFQIVRDEGISERVQNLVSENVKHITQQGISQRLGSFALIKLDFCPEKELVSYFVECLRKFQAESPEIHHVQALYDEAVHIVRKNLNSLKNYAYLHLSQKYPTYFYRIDGQKAMKEQKFVNDILPLLSQDCEDLVYFTFFHRYKNMDLESFDSVQVMDIVGLFLENQKVQNPNVIQEINSIQLYLNIERALLAYCPDLTFKGPKRNLSYILEDLNQAHACPILKKALSNPIMNQETLKRFGTKKFQEKLLGSSLNAQKEQNRLDQFLKKTFFTSDSGKSPSDKNDWLEGSFPQSKKPKKSSKKSKSKNKSKKKKASNQGTKKSKNSLPHNKKDDAPSSRQVPLQGAAFPQNIHKSFSVEGKRNKGNDETNDEEDFVIDLKAPVEFRPSPLGQKGIIAPSHDIADRWDDEEASGFIQVKKKNRQKKEAPETSRDAYKTSLKYDDYAYKRHMTTQQESGYVFKGVKYGFPAYDGSNIPLLKSLKKMIHHSPNSQHLPNTTSYVLNLHFKGQNSSQSEVARFTGHNLYLSGGHYFDEQDFSFKEKHGILCGPNDYLTASEQDTFFNKDISVRGVYLGKALEKQVREKIVLGGWKNNCHHSEALMLLDLNDQILDYLQDLHKKYASFTLEGVCLQVQNHYDTCWRCRNLIQGWQQALEHRIQYLSETFFNKSVGVATDFRTFVEVVSNKAPETPDYFKRKHLSTTVVLDDSRNENSFHKITSVKPQ